MKNTIISWDGSNGVVMNCVKKRLRCTFKLGCYFSVISLESSDSESEEDEETEENEEENKGESETIDETTTKDTEGTEEVLTPLKETSSSPKETSSPSKPTSPRKDLKDKEKKKGENEEKTTKRKKKRKRMVPVIDCKQKSHDADMMALEEVQTMEDRIASASLQIKVHLLLMLFLKWNEHDKTKKAHSFVETLSWKNFYGHSPSSADSRRAVVSYWQKNVH